MPAEGVSYVWTPWLIGIRGYPPLALSAHETYVPRKCRECSHSVGTATDTCTMREDHDYKDRDYEDRGYEDRPYEDHDYKDRVDKPYMYLLQSCRAAPMSSAVVTCCTHVISNRDVLHPCHQYS